MLWIDRKASQAIKISTFFGIFPKGLTHDFSQKFKMFSFLVSRQKKQKKCLAMFKIGKKSLQGYKSINFLKKLFFGIFQRG